MSRAIRKQLYVSPEHNRKLKRLAGQWGCTEAAVVRRALDALPDAQPSGDELFVERLRAAGKIVDPPPPTEPLLTEEEAERYQRELDEYFAKHGSPRLVEAILEDREESDRRV